MLIAHNEQYPRRRHKESLPSVTVGVPLCRVLPSVLETVQMVGGMAGERCPLGGRGASR